MSSPCIDFSQLGDRVLVFDGAMGTLLGTLGWDLGSDLLWGGSAVSEAPELVLKAHSMFIEAGADVIETNTYHVCVQKLMESKGWSRAEAESLLHKAVQIARDAISASGRPVSLVGAVGPYATYLRDASEYTGAYVKKADFQEQTIVDYYLAQCRPLVASGVSTLVFETIPSAVEVECVGRVLDELEPHVRAWVVRNLYGSLKVRDDSTTSQVSTCQDGQRTRSGDPFAEVVRLANAHPKVVAVGVNCTAPEHVTALLAEAQRAGNTKPLVVYPNSGETYNADSRQFEGDTHIDAIATSIPRWHALGARIFGGCCRVTPKHIAQIGAACRALVAQTKQN